MMMLLSMIFFLVLSVMSEAFDDVRFDENYVVRYGNDHISKLDQGREVQLSLDLASGNSSSMSSQSISMN